MGYSALLLGAVGVLAETSNIQRYAFNTAFKMNNVPWHWDARTYRNLLKVPGAKDRLAHYAQLHGADIDVDAIYDDKIAVFEGELREGVPLRPGIADLVAAAQAKGMRIGFVSATDPRQVAAILSAVKSELDSSVFNFVGDKTRAIYPKPAPDIYLQAARNLAVAPAHCVVVEDSRSGIQAAYAAGIGHIIALGPSQGHAQLTCLEGVDKVVENLAQISREELFLGQESD